MSAEVHPHGLPPAGPTIYVGLAGVHVDFPEGYWTDASHELQLPDGRTMREWRIDGLGEIIAQGLRQAWATRPQQASVLVDVNGIAITDP